jgi:hypothetical protein
MNIGVHLNEANVVTGKCPLCYDPFFIGCYISITLPDMTVEGVLHVKLNPRKSFD